MPFEARHSEDRTLERKKFFFFLLFGFYFVFLLKEEIHSPRG